MGDGLNGPRAICFSMTIGANKRRENSAVENYGILVNLHGTPDSEAHQG